MMNVEWKQKLVEALRSRTYPQARGRLRKPTGFCCLGVACDIYDASKWIKTRDDKRGEQFAYQDYHRGLMPPNIGDMFGLSTENQNILTQMNDGGKSFEEIANYIERNL